MTLQELYETFNFSSAEVVASFFQRVHENPENKQNLIRQLDNFYFSIRPRFSSGVIKQLLFGDVEYLQEHASQILARKSIFTELAASFQQSNKPSGLLILVADVEKSILGAAAAV